MPYLKDKSLTLHPSLNKLKSSNLALNESFGPLFFTLLFFDKSFGLINHLCSSVAFGFNYANNFYLVLLLLGKGNFLLIEFYSLSGR